MKNFISNLEKTIFPKKILISSILSLHATVTSFKREKFWVLIFQKTQQTLFWAHFEPFWPKNLKTRFVPKNHFGQLLKFYVAVTSCKKLHIFPIILDPDWPFWSKKYLNKIFLKKLSSANRQRLFIGRSLVSKNWVFCLRICNCDRNLYIHKILQQFCNNQSTMKNLLIMSCKLEKTKKFKINRKKSDERLQAWPWRHKNNLLAW